MHHTSYRPVTHEPGTFLRMHVDSSKATRNVSKSHVSRYDGKDFPSVVVVVVFNTWQTLGERKSDGGRGLSIVWSDTMQPLREVACLSFDAIISSIYG